MFSHINALPRSDGTILGTKLNNYLNHVNRYNQSKELVSEAQLLERGWVRNFTNFVSSKLWRYRYNYLFKGIVVIGLYSSVKSLNYYGIYLINKGKNSKNSNVFADDLTKSWIPQSLAIFGTLSLSLILV